MSVENDQIYEWIFNLNKY